MGAVVVGFGDEDFGQAVEVEFVAFGVDEFLRGGDAVFFQHDDQQFDINEWAGVEEFHEEVISDEWLVMSASACMVELGLEKRKVFGRFEVETNGAHLDAP